LVASGVMPRLSSFLKQEARPSLQIESLRAITVLLGKTKIRGHKAVLSQFIRMLSSGNDLVAAQAAKSLGILAEEPVGRDLCLKAGAMKPVLKKLEHKAEVITCKTLAQLCSGDPAPHFSHVQPALRTLARLIDAEDHRLLSFVCLTLYHLSKGGSTEKIQAILALGICKRIVELSASPVRFVRICSVWIMTNICGGDDFQRQSIIDAKPGLGALLADENTLVRQGARRLVRGIANGSDVQIQYLIDSNVMSTLIELLKEEDTFRPASSAICRVCHLGTIKQVSNLVLHNGLVTALCSLLSESDETIVERALGALLRVREFVEKRRKRKNSAFSFSVAASDIALIHALLDHRNQNIQALAADLRDFR